MDHSPAWNPVSFCQVAVPTSAVHLWDLGFTEFALPAAPCWVYPTHKRDRVGSHLLGGNLGFTTSPCETWANSGDLFLSEFLYL